MLVFNKELGFYDNLEYFLYVILNEVYMTKEEILSIIQYLERYSNASMTADDLIEYFNKKLD